MTVSLSEATSNSYSGNGTQVQFEIRFKWYQNSDILVYMDGVIQNSGYSIVIDNNTDPDASNDAIVVAYVVFDVAPANLAGIFISQVIKETQETDFLAFGKFPAEGNENALDKLTLLIRKTNEQLALLDSAVESLNNSLLSNISILANSISSVASDLDALELVVAGMSGSSSAVRAISSPTVNGYQGLTGVVNGVNQAFTLPSGANQSTIEVLVYGVVQFDWTYNSNVVTLGFAPKTNNGNEVYIRYEEA